MNLIIGNFTGISFADKMNSMTCKTITSFPNFAKYDDFEIVVIPAHAGIQSACKLQELLDSHLRGNDECECSATFCGNINYDFLRDVLIQLLLQ